jgi:hypothetical protein
VFARSIARFLVQAGFLIAAASATAIVHLGIAATVLVMAAAFGLVVAGERLATRRRPESVTTTPAAAEAARTDQQLSPAPAKPPDPAAPSPAPRSPWMPVPPLPAVSAELELRPAPVWPRAQPTTPAPPSGPVQAPPSQ